MLEWPFGCIHDWGTKKERIIEKGLQRTTLDLKKLHCYNCSGFLYFNR